MQTMKILVTGGAGFIGSHIVDAYCEQGHEVVVFDDLSSGHQSYVNSQATLVEGSVTDTSAVKALFTDHGPFTVVNHLAAQKSVTDSVKHPVNDAAINVMGSLNIFQAAYESGVKRFIFSSTGGAIYGESAPIPSAETELALPVSPYGIAKHAVEHYLRFYQSLGVTTQVLRYSNVYGPRQDPHGEAGVVAIFCQNILNGKPLTIFGDGEQCRDFVYIDDVVQANLLVLESDVSGLWNIGTATEHSVNEIAHHLNQVAQSRGLVPVSIVYDPPRQGEMRRSAIAVNKAASELAWSPKTTFEAGLSATFEQFAALSDLDKSAKNDRVKQ
jgi:UDP-glucose 4-epimerase